jgi:hypothetical protein
MPRLYTVIFENVSIPATNAMDLFELTPADDKPIEIAGMFLSNVGGAADAGDAQEELLRLLFRSGHSTSGTGGTAPTPRPAKSRADAAAGFAAEVNNTTVASAGTPLDLHADGWNVRIPYQLIVPPEMRIGASQADSTLVVRLLAGGADAINVSGTLYVLEYP